MVSKVVAVAGNLENVGGSQFEYEATRLKTSDSHSDAQKEGLRLVFKGGKHPLSGPVKQRREQQAVIEFVCDRNKTGLEGEWESEDRYVRQRSLPVAARDDGEDKDDGDDGSESGIEHQLLKDDSALIWEGYDLNEEKDVEVLRMTWSTKYACESRDEGDDGDDDGGSGSNQSWGFFTWLIIM